jgi:putative transcriptional regulator
MAKTKKLSELAKAILETAGDMREGGLMDDAAYEKITMRHLGEKARAPAVPLTGQEIRALREQAHMSQAVFAHHLNLTVQHLSKLERGATRSSGPAIVLLNVIRRKGIEAIL